MQAKLLALTVLQPFATGIVQWGKPVENRSWLPGARLPVGSWLAIHAGAKDYPDADDIRFRNWIGSLCNDHNQRFATGYLTKLPHSAIVGVARVAGFSDSSAKISCWSAIGQEQWRFDQHMPFVEPVPCKGMQGLWEVKGDVLAKVREQWDPSKVRTY